jgi:hypothetical protein
MVADTLEELHRMARKIGLKREWFQDHDIPHYDVTNPKRRLAVANGAKEITRKELYEFIKRWRASELHAGEGSDKNTP